MLDQYSGLSDQFGYAAISVYVIQALKKLPFLPFINEHTTTLNRIISVGAALVTSVGVSYQLTAASDGGHQLVIGIPSLQQMVSLALRAGVQIALHQGIYNTAVKPKEPLAVVPVAVPVNQPPANGV